MNDTPIPDWATNAMREIIDECARAYPAMPAGTRVTAIIASKEQRNG